MHRLGMLLTNSKNRMGSSIELCVTPFSIYLHDDIIISALRSWVPSVRNQRSCQVLFVQVGVYVIKNRTHSIIDNLALKIQTGSKLEFHIWLGKYHFSHNLLIKLVRWFNVQKLIVQQIFSVSPSVPDEVFF